MKVKHLERDTDGKLPTYAWPGGYPLVYYSDDGHEYCPDCASQVDAEPPITHVDINWEEPDLTCCGCGAAIEAAYEPDEVYE